MLTSLQFVLGQISWLLRSAIVLILAMGLSSGTWMFMTFRLVLYGFSLQKPFFKHVIWYLTTSTVVRRVQYRSSRRAKVEIIKSLVLMQQQRERDARLREVNATADFEDSMMTKSSNTTTPTTSAMRRNVTISAPEKSPNSSTTTSPRRLAGEDAEEKAKNDTLFTMSFNHFVKATSRCSRPVSPAAGVTLQGSFGTALPKAEDNVSSAAASAAAAATGNTTAEPSEDEIIRRFLAWTEEHCDDDDAYVHNRAFMDVFLPVPLDQLVSLKLRSFYNAFNRYRRKKREAKKHKHELKKGTSSPSTSAPTSATTSEDDDGMSVDNDSDVEMLNDSAFSMPSTPGSEGLRKRSDDYNIMKPVINQLAERKIPKYKVCIIVSGGAWIIGFYLWSALLARLFAAAGYVVFIPDYRNFPQTDVAGMAEDVTDAIVYVKKHAHKYHADATKDVTLIGHSAGSHLTMLSLIQQATLCAARDAWERVHGAATKGGSSPTSGGSPASRADTATPAEDAHGLNSDRPFALSDLQEAYRDAMQAENNNNDEANLHTSIFNGSIFARSLLKRGTITSSIHAAPSASFEAANKADGATSGIDLASLDYLPADSSFFTPALAEHHRHTHLHAKMTPAAPPRPRYHPPTTIHHYIGVSGLYDFTALLDFLNKRGLYSSVMYRVLGYREKAPNEPVDPKEEEDIKDKLLKEYSPWWFLVKENKDGNPEDYRCSFLSEEHREVIESNVRDFNENRSLVAQWMKKHGKAPSAKPGAVTIDTQAVPYLPSTMRFVHGDLDMSAPPEQSNLMYAALSEAIHQYASEHLVGKKPDREKGKKGEKDHKDNNKDKDKDSKDKDGEDGDSLPNNDGVNNLLPRVHLTTIPGFNHTDLINEQPLCGECTLLEMCNKDIHDLDTAVARFEAKKQHHPNATDKDSMDYPFSTKRPYNPRILPEKMPVMIRFGRYVCPF